MNEAESEVLLLLDIEHKNLAHVLDVFERELTRLQEGGAPDTPLLRDIGAYFLGFPDKCHHPKEDLILERLLALAPEQQELLGGLEDEHEQMSAESRTLADLINRLTTVPDATLRELIEEGRAFVEHYRKHMKMEESGFFPEAHRILTGGDWRTINFNVFDAPDPVFSESDERSFSFLRDRIGREASWNQPDKA